MCEQIKENKKPAIIGGAIFAVILIIVIVLIVVLTGDSSDNDISSSSGSGSSSNSNSGSSGLNDSNQTNILFIIVDDLGWTDISLHGSEYETPHLDSLIESGIKLTNYYTHPVCTPTRASFLTGKYSWKLGMQDVQTMGVCDNEEIPADTPTIAELLGYLGYRTYYVGKWHLGYSSWNRSTPVGRGFDYGFGMLQGEGDFYSHQFSIDLSDDPDISLSGYDLWDMDTRTPYLAGNGTYSTDLFYNKAIEYLGNHSDGEMFGEEAFYMYLSWQTIHEPMQYEEDTEHETCTDIDNPERKIYCDKMVYFDDKLGDLIDWLKGNNLYNNTLIVVTTDNGGIVNYTSTVDPSVLFMPQSDGCNYPYRAGKATLFEGGIKTIGFLTGQIIENLGLNGSVFSQLTHSVDWFTTLIEGVGKKNTQYSGDEYNVTAIAQSFGFDNLSDTGTIDGLNLFDYFDSGSGSEKEWTREYIYVNIDRNNKMTAAQNITINETEYFDTIIYQDLSDDSNTIWKYIRGHQLYWNYYYCNQSVYINDDTLNSTSEWLFNLTDNPYEYEEDNLMYLDFNDSNNDDIYQIRQLLISEIDYQIYNGSYYDRQNLTTYFDICLPICHNNTWSPFLDLDDANDASCQPNISDSTIANLKKALLHFAT